MDASAMFPQCMSVLRFHEMVQGKAFSDKERIALATDATVAGEYAALRNCDEAYNNILAVGQREMQRLKHRGQHGHDHESESSGVDGMSSSEVAYVGYVDCVSKALCPSALQAWYGCLEEAKEGQRTPESCTVVKHMLERCLRAETDALFRASQKHVFRPSS